MIVGLDVKRLGGDWFDAGSVEDAPDAKGAYGLVIALDRDVVVTFKRNQEYSLPAGHYVYAGSAYGPGGLAARLRRHFKREKKIHWHVDQLTLKAASLSAFVVPGGDECLLIRQLQETGRYSVPIAGFGSSDCKLCQSHLLQLTPSDKCEGGQDG